MTTPTDQDLFTLHGVTYVARPFQKQKNASECCAGCAFEGDENPCNLAPYCYSEKRHDNQMIIWVPQPTPEEPS